MERKPARASLKRLNDLRRNRLKEIRRRLKDFKTLYQDSEERIFEELCFCICTPQSSATTCWDCILDLSRSRILYEGREEDIVTRLRGVRFKENKARFILEARRLFTTNGAINVKNKLKEMLDERGGQQTGLQHFKARDRQGEIGHLEIENLREVLAARVKGLGMKEASHFLRNIGLGGELAILDRHVLRNLEEFGVIDEAPEVLSKKTYLEIERRMRCFSREIGIPMEELDLLLWAKETGIVFK